MICPELHTLMLQRPSEKVSTDPKKPLQIQSQKVFGAVGMDVYGRYTYEITGYNWDDLS